jgi:hypothetical protein
MLYEKQDAKTMHKFFLILLIVFNLLGMLNGQSLSDNYQYEVDLVYDSTNRQFSCNMTIAFDQLPKDLKELPFHFLIDSTNDQTIKTRINNSNCEFEILKDFKNGLIVNLNPDFDYNGSIEIRIEFKTIKHGDYLNNNQILFNDSWIPMLQYYENGDFVNCYQKHSNYKVNITYPNDFIIATSGEIIRQSEKDNQMHIQTKAESIPSYGLVMSRDFLISEARTKNEILIRSFYNDNDIKWGNKLLDIAEDVIDFYTDTLGFYPHPVLTIIPGADKPYGGWPVSPNIICIHRGIDTKGDYANTHATWITAHEIGHQYWGFGYVLEPLNYPQWFGISMGIYTDWLYSNSRKVQRDYLVFFNRYIYGFNKGYNTTIMQLTDSLNKQNFDWNNVIKHGKSFAVLRMLAYEIGEDTFFKVFNYCLEHYKGINVTLDMFQHICEEISSQDLNWFFVQWYKTNKYLAYEISEYSSKQNTYGYITNCILLRKGDAVVSLLEIGFKQENGDMSIKTIDGKILENEIIIETKLPVVSIIIDPYNKYPLVNREDFLITN